jgi:hypothetical protein
MPTAAAAATLMALLVANARQQHLQQLLQGRWTHRVAAVAAETTAG